MIALTLKEIAEACGGALNGADPDAVATSVVIDSRAVQAGSVFVALRGEHEDGHGYIPAALRAGAAAALSQHGGERCIRVGDTLRALGDVAAHARTRLRAQVIAVTGSSGKTCTKDLTATAVATERRTVASPASYNNEIGVPLTILRADERTEVLVVEVGSRGLGHIAALAPIIRPDVAVITNIGSAHIGMFGSTDVTARAKAELLDALGVGGVAVLNADDPLLRGLSVRSPVVWFGADGDVRAERVALDADAHGTFTLVAGGEHAPVSLRMPGAHMIPNALAAAAAARAVGVSTEGIARGLSACGSPAWRMEVREVAGRRLINDAYNANPDSMAAALAALVAMAGVRPSWAVLGFMAELGSADTDEHERIGRLAVRLGVGRLVTVGEQARAIHEGARLEGMSEGAAHLTSDAGEALALLRASLEPDAVVLVKASRAAGLERIAKELGA